MDDYNSMKILTLSGVHGTTVSRAEKIAQDGFKPSEAGYRGKGIYFWRRNPYVPEYTNHLAISWYLTAKAQGHYSKDTDGRCAIISAQIKVAEDNFVDLTGPEVNDQLVAFYYLNKYKDEMKAASLYDEFIEQLEQELNCGIQVITLTFPTPSKCKICPKQALGMPLCYVVKQASCIEVVSINKLTQEELNLWQTLNESNRQ